MLIDARHNVTLPEGRYKTDPHAIIGIAIHHTVTLFYPRPDMTVADERAHISMIDRYHVSQGWGGFGYHTITFPSGRSYQTGDLDGARAHVASRNGELIGCAFAGDHTSVAPTPEAMAGGAEAVSLVRATFTQTLSIGGHRYWALPAWPTSCPGDALTYRIHELVQPAVEEDDMPDAIFRDAANPKPGFPEGRVAQVGVCGRHNIGSRGHYDALLRAGARVVDVDPGTFDSVPEVTALIYRGATGA